MSSAIARQIADPGAISPSPSAPALQAGGWLRPRTADVHHIAIAFGRIRIDKSRYQQPTVNGNYFAILFSTSRSVCCSRKGSNPSKRLGKK
jgi:hypothetical protein